MADPNKLEKQHVQELLYRRPGPLRPVFVQRMMRYEQGKTDDELRKQIFDRGKKMPWDIPDGILITGKDREAIVVIDYLTRKMKMNTNISKTECIDTVPVLDCRFRNLVM